MPRVILRLSHLRRYTPGTPDVPSEAIDSPLAAPAIVQVWLTDAEFVTMRQNGESVVMLKGAVQSVV